MQTLKTLVIESERGNYKVEVCDSFTDQVLWSTVIKEEEQFFDIKGFMNWYLRVYRDNKLIYEECPFTVAPPKREPHMKTPRCLIGTVKKEGKINVYQFWNAVNLGQRLKQHFNGTCVIRMGGIGDLVALSSGLQALKDKYPHVELTLATQPQFVNLYKKAHFLDNVIPLSDLEYARFDKVIDLRWAVEPPQIGSGKNTWENYTTKDRSDLFDELLGVYPSQKRFSIFTEPSEEMKSITGKLGSFIAINAAMVTPTRCIPPNYIEPLCKLINTRLHMPIVLFGVTQDWNRLLLNIETEGVVNLIDKTSIEEVITLISESSLLITPDTGSLHIAGALGKKCIALFGNINPRTRISYYPNARVLYPHGALPCVPCWDVRDCLNDLEDGSRCMRLLTPEIIFDAIRQELGMQNGPVKSLFCYVERKEKPTNAKHRGVYGGQERRVLRGHGPKERPAIRERRLHPRSDVNRRDLREDSKSQAGA